MNYPEYVEVEGKLYKINTNYTYALQCDKIARDDDIGDYERVLAILYTLYGEEGINTPEHYEKLLELALKYLSCGNELKIDEEPDMDFEKDYGYIWASFMSDYNGLDIEKTEIHWWKFMELINGLSNSEFGDCCILNRIRNLRNYDLKDVKDPKERQKIKKAKEQVALKKKPTKQATNEQLKSAKDFIKALGLEKE